MSLFPPVNKKNAAYWSCVAGSVLVMVIGWFFSVRHTVQQTVVGAKSEFSTIVQTAKSFKEAGKPPPELGEQIAEAGAVLASPVIEAAEKRQDLVEIMAEKIKTEVETEPTL
jgi:hypothetical protein